MNGFLIWVKRILFTLLMTLSVFVSVFMLFDSQGKVLFLDILSIFLEIGSCVLYFIFNESQKLPIVLCLIALFADSIYLAFSVEGNLYGICAICAFVGFIISCGVRWLKSETFSGVIGALTKAAFYIGILAGIGVSIYMLFAKK